MTARAATCAAGRPDLVDPESAAAAPRVAAVGQCTPLTPLPRFCPGDKLPLHVCRWPTWRAR